MEGGPDREAPEVVWFIPVRIFKCSYLILYIYIWVNYNDLTVTSLESWLVREIIPFYGLNSGWWIIIIYPYIYTHTYLVGGWPTPLKYPHAPHISPISPIGWSPVASLVPRLVETSTTWRLRRDVISINGAISAVPTCHWPKAWGETSKEFRKIIRMFKEF